MSEADETPVEAGESAAQDAPDEEAAEDSSDGSGAEAE